MGILIGQMTVEEKVGQFFHTMISASDDGELSDGLPEFSIASNREYVAERYLSHFNVLGAVPSAETLARWHNTLQELAAGTHLGIPVTISTDPRHSYSENPGAAIITSAFSQWPESLGLAATRDVDLVHRFAEICRQEYAAVGIRVALHPQIDLATEPRWARQLQTFGEDAKLSGELGAAYIRGLQGESFGPGSVSAMTKHFPGGGPQKDGEDPHFPYGAEHLTPHERMAKILDAGCDQFGGEQCDDILLDLVRSGRVTEERLDVSLRRILREKFELGLLEDPYVDVSAVAELVGTDELRAAGDEAQRASVTVLANNGALPFTRGAKLYVEGIPAEVAAEYGEVVATPAGADLAVLRVQAPFTPSGPSVFESFFHSGPLDFPSDALAHIAEVSAAVPTAVDVFLDRPAIIAPIVDSANAVVANWGVSSANLLDVLSGASPARGKLPFDVPRSTSAVEASHSDVAFSTPTRSSASGTACRSRARAHPKRGPAHLPGECIGPHSPGPARVCASTPAWCVLPSMAVGPSGGARDPQRRTHPDVTLAELLFGSGAHAGSRPG